jgi:hypothetical protein
MRMEERGRRRVWPDLALHQQGCYARKGRCQAGAEAG